MTAKPSTTATLALTGCSNPMPARDRSAACQDLSTIFTAPNDGFPRVDAVHGELIGALLAFRRTPGLEIRWRAVADTTCLYC
jgi:hypothetical protein